MVVLRQDSGAERTKIEQRPIRGHTEWREQDFSCINAKTLGICKRYIGDNAKMTGAAMAPSRAPALQTAGKFIR
jgi:hypothetical protein